MNNRLIHFLRLGLARPENSIKFRTLVYYFVISLSSTYQKFRTSEVLYPAECGHHVHPESERYCFFLPSFICFKRFAQAASALSHRHYLCSFKIQ